MNWYREYQAEWKEIIEIAENLGLVLSNPKEIKSMFYCVTYYVKMVIILIIEENEFVTKQKWLNTILRKTKVAYFQVGTGSICSV